MSQRYNAFGPDQQKKIDLQVKNAMKSVEDAKRLIAQQRALGKIPPASYKAVPMSGNFAMPPNIPFFDGSELPGKFNMLGGSIGNAVIGSDQPVTFNQKMNVFNEGSQQTSYKILGGEFHQANIGGQVTTNNVRSTVGISDDSSGISHEDLMIEILEKGLPFAQLIQLLERGYSLANIAFSLPENIVRRNQMISVLLS